MIKDTIKYILISLFALIVIFIGWLFFSVPKVLAAGTAQPGATNWLYTNVDFNMKLYKADGSLDETFYLWQLNEYYGTSSSVSNFDDFIVRYDFISGTSLEADVDYVFYMNFWVFAPTPNTHDLSIDDISVYWGNRSNVTNNSLEFNYDGDFILEKTGQGNCTGGGCEYPYVKYYSLKFSFSFSSAHYLRLQLFLPDEAVNQGIWLSQFGIYNEDNPPSEAELIINNNNSNTQTIINNNNYNSEKEREAINDNTEAINNVNNSINNSSVDNPSQSINDLQNALPTNGVISDLLLLPVTLFRVMLNGIGGTCSTISLGQLYGTELILPCIDLENIVGFWLWNIIDYLSCFAFILGIRKTFVKIFNNFTNLRDGGNAVE